MSTLKNFFAGCLFGHHTPMEKAIKDGKIQKIIISSKAGLGAGNHDGVIVELRKPKDLKTKAKEEVDVVASRPNSLVGIKKPKGKGKNKCMVTVAYAIVA